MTRSDEGATLLREVLRTFYAEDGDDGVEHLLVDVRHYADAMGFDFSKIDRDAGESYYTELAIECGGKVATKTWRDAD